MADRTRLDNLEAALEKVLCTTGNFSQHEIFKAVNGDESLLNEVTGGYWSMTPQSERPRLINAICKQLVIVATVTNLAEWVILKNFVTKNKFSNIVELLTKANRLNPLVSIEIGNVTYTTPTPSFKNKLESLCILCSVLGDTGIRVFQAITNSMLVEYRIPSPNVDTDTEESKEQFPANNLIWIANSTRRSEPHCLGFIPIGVATSDLSVVTSATDILTAEQIADDLVEYQTIATEIAQAGIEVNTHGELSAGSILENVAPNHIWAKVFSTRYFEDLLNESYIDGQINAKPVSSELYPLVSFSGPIIGVEDFKVISLQALFNAATAERKISNNWVVYCQNGQLKAKEIFKSETFPERLKRIRSLINLSTTFAELGEAYLIAQSSDQEHEVSSVKDSVTEQLSYDFRKKLESFAAATEPIEVQAEIFLRDTFRLSPRTKINTIKIENIEELPPQDVRQLRTKNGYWSSIDLNDLHSFSHLSNIILPDAKEDQNKALKKSLRLSTGLGGFIQSAVLGTLTSGQNSRVLNSNGTLYYQLSIPSVVMNIAVYINDGEIVIDTNFTSANKPNSQKANTQTSATEKINNAEKSFKRFKKLLESLASKAYLAPSDYENLKNAVFRLQPYKDYYDQAKALLGEMMELGYACAPESDMNNGVAERKPIKWLHLDLCDDRNPSYAKLAGDLMEYLTSIVWGRHAYEHFTDNAIRYLKRLGKQKPAWVMNIKTADKGHFGNDDRTQIIRLLLENDPDQIGFAVCLDKQDH